MCCEQSILAENSVWDTEPLSIALTDVFIHVFSRDENKMNDTENCGHRKLITKFRDGLCLPWTFNAVTYGMEHLNFLNFTYEKLYNI